MHVSHSSDIESSFPGQSERVISARGSRLASPLVTIHDDSPPSPFKGIQSHDLQRSMRSTRASVSKQINNFNRRNKGTGRTPDFNALQLQTHQAPSATSVTGATACLSRYDSRLEEWICTGSKAHGRRLRIYVTNQGSLFVSL
jgi:hypothetical protein